MLIWALLVWMVTKQTCNSRNKKGTCTPLKNISDKEAIKKNPTYGNMFVDLKKCFTTMCCGGCVNNLTYSEFNFFFYVFSILLQTILVFSTVADITYMKTSDFVWGEIFDFCLATCSPFVLHISLRMLPKFNPHLY